MLNSSQIQAIYKLYPQTVYTSGDEAFDVNNQQVNYDLSAVTAQAESEKAQAIAVKESALAKLAALGLTQDEVKALLG
jgi:hypothetical protein